jgi:hypothetical protein
VPGSRWWICSVMVSWIDYKRRRAHCQYPSIISNIFPITNRISVIWKQETRANSHLSPVAFPIIYGCRTPRNNVEPSHLSSCFLVILWQDSCAWNKLHECRTYPL